MGRSLSRLPSHLVVAHFRTALPPSTAGEVVAQAGIAGMKHLTQNEVHGTTCALVGFNPSKSVSRGGHDPEKVWGGFGDARGGQAALIAETSNSSLILSDTMTPPVSSAAFQVRPQSLRLMAASPSKPIRTLP